ncbi:MAG: biotin transporter BioY [Saprospiraceae bacterium]
MNQLITLLTILFGTFLISISANIPLNVPLLDTEIPGTWQTFAVLVFAFATNRWIALSATVLYLLVGGFGLPVFADGDSGWLVLIGNSAGYLYGFVIAAFIVGILGEKDWKKDFGKSFAAMFIGTLIILIFGVTYLGFKIGLEDGIRYGFTPFILGAFIKIILGSLVLPLFYKLSKIP